MLCTSQVLSIIFPCVEFGIFTCMHYSTLNVCDCTGVGTYLKTKNPDIKVVLADPQVYITYRHITYHMSLVFHPLQNVGFDLFVGKVSQTHSAHPLKLYKMLVLNVC